MLWNLFGAGRGKREAGSGKRDAGSGKRDAERPDRGRGLTASTIAD
ncbi:MAG: hypothetical protein ACREMS_08975 [Gemmatimonadaceae bacterium]